MWFTAETREAWNEKFHLMKTYFSPDGLSLVIPFPHPPKSVRTDGVRWRHNQIFTDG